MQGPDPNWPTYGMQQTEGYGIGVCVAGVGQSLDYLRWCNNSLLGPNSQTKLSVAGQLWDLTGAFVPGGDEAEIFTANWREVK